MCYTDFEMEVVCFRGDRVELGRQDSGSFSLTLHYGYRRNILRGMSTTFSACL